ncbi:TadE/TadG family type IV pilus assembly protein [Novosphingobium umbonatum]|uniref:TadE/TadG family type IV pilus assembly protein n=1 Tax=Novosphingobium umbonatum TaxID=1908524 RepID=UPI0013E310EE|nr:pilus assembly protein TadG-related protein [Novosphingobium umbonatum]
MRIWPRLWHDARGNVLMMCGFILVPLIFAIGFGIDYSRAMRLQTILNAAADSAALSAVSNTAMAGTTQAAQTTAINMFKAQVTGLTGLVFDSSTDITVTITTTSSASSASVRTATVAWRAKSTNLFSSILKSGSLAIAGTAKAAASKAPYINYYLLLDISPSMLLPTTTAGMDALRNATKARSNSPYGCTFACHTSTAHNNNIYIQNTAGQDIWLDSSNNAWPVSSIQNGYVYSSSYRNGSQPVGAFSSGVYADTHWLSRNYSSLYGGSVSIPLRIDAETEASRDLIETAQSYAASNNVTYKMQIFSFDWPRQNENVPVRAVTSSMADVNSMSRSSVPDLYTQQVRWYSNFCPGQNYCINDEASQFTTTLSLAKSYIPTAGDGTTSAKAKQVLLIITDGMLDESRNGSRYVGEMHADTLTQCSAIKAKGVMIGVLYTTYDSATLTGDSWSTSVVAPRIPYVAPALKSCASTTSSGEVMFYEVGANGDISAALASLFAMTMQSARLTQ